MQSHSKPYRNQNDFKSPVSADSNWPINLCSTSACSIYSPLTMQAPAQHWEIYVGKKWVAEDESESIKKLENTRGIKGIIAYYANMVGVARVVLAMVAACTIYLDWPLTTATLLMASTLLDWIDGPLARKYNQSTIFGAGLDWFADLLVQMLIMLWWARLDPFVLPWQFALMALEIALCIVDSSMLANGWYPCRPRNGFKDHFYCILNWVTPGAGTWTRFGTFLWLSDPVCSLGWCLHLTWRHTPLHPLTNAVILVTRWALVVPSVLHWWGELAQFCFLLSNWREQ